MVFPVVMYECESWIIKKAECRRIDAFELWCRRRLLRVPWTARRSNQSILKEISPGCSLEGSMLKLQYFGHLMGRTDSLEKTLMLGKIEGRRRRGQQRMRWLDAIIDSWTWVWVDSGSWWGLMCCNPWGRKVGHDWATELNWISNTGSHSWDIVCVCMPSHLSRAWLFCDPMDPNKAPLSMRFPRQECWSGLSCPPPGDLPDLGSTLCLLRLPCHRGFLLPSPLIIPSPFSAPTARFPPIWG